jgi:hypothetical protein
MDKRIYNGILIGILVISLALLFFSNVNAITGRATEGSTYSNVTIERFLAIEMSPELDFDGIDFGNIEDLGVDNYNATENYNGASNSTLYWIRVSNNSNTAVDLCTRANAPMTNAGGAEIPLVNQSYASNVTVSDLNNPSLSNAIGYTTTYQEGHFDVPVGNTSYWRFWLDAPYGQETGDYNNTVYFQGKNTGSGC